MNADHLVEDIWKGFKLVAQFCIDRQEEQGKVVEDWVLREAIENFTLSLVLSNSTCRDEAKKTVTRMAENVLEWLDEFLDIEFGRYEEIQDKQ